MGNFAAKRDESHDKPDKTQNPRKAGCKGTGYNLGLT